MALKQAFKQFDYYVNQRNPDDVISKEKNYPASYIKVESLSGTKEKITFDVNRYEDSSKESVITNGRYSFVPTMDSNFIAQAYNYLKTLPEFDGAEDC